MKKLYLFLFLILSTAILSAQRVVTIEQCQQWAVSQTSANVQKDLNGQILKTNYHNAGAHLFPKLSINGRFAYESVDAPPLTPFDQNPEWARMQYHIGLDLEQVVFDGCKLFYGRQFARLQNDAEIYKIELSMNEIKAQVINLYLSLLILDKQIGIIQNVQSTFDDQLKQLRVLYKEGVIP